MKHHHPYPEAEHQAEPPPSKAWPVVWMIVGLAVGAMWVRFG